MDPLSTDQTNVPVTPDPAAADPASMPAMDASAMPAEPASMPAMDASAMSAEPTPMPTPGGMVTPDGSVAPVDLSAEAEAAAPVEPALDLSGVSSPIDETPIAAEAEMPAPATDETSPIAQTGADQTPPQNGSF